MCECLKSNRLFSCSLEDGSVAGPNSRFVECVTPHTKDVSWDNSHQSLLENFWFDFVANQVFVRHLLVESTIAKARAIGASFLITWCNSSRDSMFGVCPI
jgi:hypothetical protein